MRRDPLPSVDPSVLAVSLPREAAAGSTFAIDVVIRNFGTVAATDVRCAIATSGPLAATIALADAAGASPGGTVVVVPSLDAGGIVRMRGLASVADDAPASVVRIETTLSDASGAVASVERFVDVTARGRADAVSTGHVRVDSQKIDDESFVEHATVTASVDEAVPGVPFSWTIVARLAGGSGDDYAIELQALGCDVERGSLRAIVGDSSIAIPTSRRGGSLLARVAALCALDRLVVVCDGIVATPHIAGAAIAVEAAIARADRSVAARTTVNVRSAPRFANVPEAITPLDPLVAGTTARVAFALVNVGTASAHGVRVSGSVEGANGASFALSKTSRDDMVPARTEVIDGRLVLPAPLRDGTLVTLSATVAANGCEPTVVRRVLAVRSLPSFSRDTSRIGFGDDAPMRPNAVRSLTITIANEGTDRADDLRVYLTLPPWLRCADRAEDAAAVVVPSLAAGERFETDLDVAASADAPPGTFAVLAELAWNGGSFALDALTGVVETHAAFGDATLEADAATRESDDTIAYRLSLTNTGDGACRVLRIRTELGGPATYARGSFTVNGRRVRDVGNTSVAFGEGVVVEDVPVGAAIVCTWRCCVDTDIATAAVVECRATLAWDAEGSSVVEAPAVAVVPSRAFPTVAAALPARVPHAAIALATPISDALSPAAAVVAYDRSERARLRCDYLEGTVAASGLVAVLDLRIFLPFAADEVRERDDAARIAIRAFVRAVDRTAIGMRLGVALLRSDAVVSDDVRAAFGRYRSDLRDAPLGTVLLSVIDEFTSLENGAEAFEALEAYRTALRGLVAWWCSREDEIADLLAAEMPVAVATVRAAAIDALTRHLDRAVA